MMGGWERIGLVSAGGEKLCIYTWHLADLFVDANLNMAWSPNVFGAQNWKLDYAGV